MQKGSCKRPDEASRTGARTLRAGAGRLVSFFAAGALAGLFSIGTACAAPKHADFGSEAPSKEARFIADWAVDSADPAGKPFAIVDKTAARAYVFKPDGQLRGAAPVLLGIAKGDDTMPGIGDLEYSQMPVAARTTPAGRFVAAIGRNAHNKDVLWVDYDAAISMHRVINTNPKERRPHRLDTPTAADNRISFGCINVPIKFFDDVISPAFEGTEGIVYVLPEVHPLKQVFAKAYDVEEHTRADASADAPADVPAATIVTAAHAPARTPARSTRPLRD